MTWEATRDFLPVVLHQVGDPFPRARVSDHEEEATRHQHPEDFRQIGLEFLWARPKIEKKKWKKWSKLNITRLGIHVLGSL